MILLIFDFLQAVGMYKKEDVTRAEIKLLEETKMIDFAIEKYQTLGEEAPEELVERRTEVFGVIESVRERVLKLLQILEDEDSVKMISTFKSTAELCKQFELDEDVVEGLVDFAKLHYDCGGYAPSAECLKHYRSIIGNDAERPMTSTSISVIWGHLAS